MAGSWWWSCQPSGVSAEDDGSAAEDVRSYWDMEVLSSSPVSRRRPSMDELEKEQEFPTDDLSEEELAELGRVLLRVQGLEAKTRATREFLASRQKAGKDYWEGRVASKRNELSRDKKALAKGQARRASFFASKKVRFKI